MCAFEGSRRLRRGSLGWRRPCLYQGDNFYQQLGTGKESSGSMCVTFTNSPRQPLAFALARSARPSMQT